jgi:hypothetical protein
MLLSVAGMGLIISCFIPLRPLSTETFGPSRGFQIVVSLVLALALLRAAYLSWYRWSPLAIRHLVGCVFFFVTLFCVFYLPARVPSGWGIFVFLLALPVCYTLYRLIVYMLSRRAFPSVSNAQVESQCGD